MENSGEKMENSVERNGLSLCMIYTVERGCMKTVLMRSRKDGNCF